MIVYFFSFRHTFLVEANPLYPFTDYKKILGGQLRFVHGCSKIQVNRVTGSSVLSLTYMKILSRIFVEYADLRFFSPGIFLPRICYNTNQTYSLPI